MAIETIRPTASSTAKLGIGTGTVTNASSAYDANLSTYATVLASSVKAEGCTETFTIGTTWGTKSQTWTSWVIKVKRYAICATTDSNQSGSFKLGYSTNSGGAYTYFDNLTMAGGDTVAEDTVTIGSGSGNPTLSTFRVASVCAGFGDLSNSGSVTAYIYEVWIEGTYSSSTTYNQDVIASSTTAGSVMRGIGMAFLAGVGKVISFTKSIIPPVFTAGQTLTATMGRVAANIRAVSASSTTGAVIVRGIAWIRSATPTTTTATIAKLAGFKALLTVGINCAATLGILRGKYLAAGATLTASLASQRGRVMSAASTLTATIAKVRLAFLTATGIVASGVMQKTVALVAFTKTISLLPLLGRLFHGVLTATALTCTATLAAVQPSVSKIMIAGVGLISSTSRGVFRILSASASGAASLVGTVGKAMNADIYLSPAMIRRFGITLSRAILTVLSMVRAFTFAPLTGGQTATPVLIRSITGILSSGVASGAGILKGISKTVTAAQGIVPAVWKRLAQVVAATQGNTASLAMRQTLVRAVSAVSTLVASRRLSVVKALSAGAGSLASILFPATKRRAISALASTGATILKGLSDMLAAGITSVANLVRRVGFPVVASIGALASIYRGLLGRLTATQGTSASIYRQLQKIVSATSSTTATFIRSISLPARAGASVSSLLIRRVGFALRAGMGYNVQIARSFTRVLVSTLATAATVSENRFRTQMVSASLTLAATISQRLALVLAMASTLSTVATLSKIGRYQRALAGNLVVYASMFLRYSRVLLAGSSTAATMGRISAAVQILTCSLTITETVAKLAGIALGAGLVSAAVILRLLSKRLISTILLAPTMVRVLFALLVGGVSIIATMVRVFRFALNMKFYFLAPGRRRTLKG